MPMFTLGELSLASVLSLLLGGIIVHFLAKDRSREDRTIARFNAAAATLREAFAGDVMLLRGPPTEPGDTYDRLKASFPSHEKAVFRFRELLPARSHPDFDAAWREYFFPEGIRLLLPEEETPEYILGQYIGLNHEEEKERKEFALTRIEKLLAFAKEQ